MLLFIPSTSEVWLLGRRRPDKTRPSGRFVLYLHPMFRVAWRSLSRSTPVAEAVAVVVVIRAALQLAALLLVVLRAVDIQPPVRLGARPHPHAGARAAEQGTILSILMGLRPC